ncbi:MAG: mechanosensitive ion channel [Bacteroidales bacterium]|nr:mechanosensitive ion channel [Bacteroidales bacterium]
MEQKKSFLDSLSQSIKDLFISNWGLSEGLANWLHLIVFALIIIIIAWAADRITKQFIIVLIKRIVKKTKTSYDDIFFEQGVFNRLAHISPALVVYYMLPTILTDFSSGVVFLQHLTIMYMILVGILVVISFLNALNAIYNQRKNASSVPIKGYIQVVQIIIIIIGIVWALGVIFNFDPKGFFAGLGAFAAVLMLIFKDTILGVVASIQITANKMLSIGDWISMPSRNADGTVIDVSVNTVKVQNWDKTIATIPTYALVTESFHNWRGMEESGGRRIKRSVNIDMSSVKFCTPEMLNKYRKIQLISEYVDSRHAEVEQYNSKLGADEGVLVNGRRMTNIGTFRRYLEEYLKKHPKIHPDMTFLVRQLQPTERGIPIEIYVFSTDQAWANYESIQADIFDHILAILPEFDLRIFQNPTGQDFKQLK